MESGYTFKVGDVFYLANSGLEPTRFSVCKIYFLGVYQCNTVSKLYTPVGEMKYYFSYEYLRWNAVLCPPLPPTPDERFKRMLHRV